MLASSIDSDPSVSVYFGRLSSRYAYSFHDAYLLVTGCPLNAYFGIVALRHDKYDAQDSYLFPWALLMAYEADYSTDELKAIEFHPSMTANPADYQKSQFDGLEFDLREAMIREAFGNESR